MAKFNRFFSILALCFVAQSYQSQPIKAANIDELALQWKQLDQRIQNIKVPMPTTRVIYRTTPFKYVEALEIETRPGRLPIRGFAFDLSKSRIVIIQNLFDTAGASLSDYAKLQFSKMLRSLLPRNSLKKSYELEVRGFTDIQTFGHPLDLKNCDISKPRNNACLGQARAINTSEILQKYVLQTLGAGLPIVKKYDPDPLMHNFNLQSKGKVWTATGAEIPARKIAKMFVFEKQLDQKLELKDILSIRRKSARKAKKLKKQIEALLQPFRCTIVIAWRS